MSRLSVLIRSWYLYLLSCQRGRLDIKNLSLRCFRKSRLLSRPHFDLNFLLVFFCFHVEIACYACLSLSLSWQMLNLDVTFLDAILILKLRHGLQKLFIDRPKTFWVWDYWSSLQIQEGRGWRILIVMGLALCSSMLWCSLREASVTDYII